MLLSKAHRRLYFKTKIRRDGLPLKDNSVSVVCGRYCFVSYKQDIVSSRQKKRRAEALLKTLGVS